MKRALIGCLLALICGTAYAGEVDLGWGYVESAEAYIVYVTPQRGSYVGGGAYDETFPVCGGYYDPGTLIEGEGCVDRDEPQITLTGVPNSSPSGMHWFAVKAKNEAGTSSDFSNDVPQHLIPPDNVPGFKRAVLEVTWRDGRDPVVKLTEAQGLKLIRKQR